MILAHTRVDVAELNQLARERMRQAGVLGAEVTVATERGERTFAEGDRVMFLRNERGLGVKNGTLGTVVDLPAGGLQVRLDDGREVGRRPDGLRGAWTTAACAEADQAAPLSTQFPAPDRV